MASANDFFNELKAANVRLDTLITSTGEVRVAIERVAASMDQSVALEVTMRDALVHQIRQNETIICLLKQIADSTCRTLDEAHRQTGLQTTMRDHTGTLAELYTLEHAASALVRERDLALKRQIEACCPPPVAETPCHPKPCPEPDPFKLPVILLEQDAPKKRGKR